MMQIRGVPLNDFRMLAERVSDELYAQNVFMAPDAHPVGHRRIVARLRVDNSRGPGARTAASGRHGPYACWHAYRDVLQAVFCAYPHASVRTALATYGSWCQFEERFPATAYRNIGSLARPAFMPELCVTPGCGDVLPVDDVEWAEAEMWAEWEAPETGFTGPVSLLGIPDLAYSDRR